MKKTLLLARNFRFDVLDESSVLCTGCSHVNNTEPHQSTNHPSCAMCSWCLFSSMNWRNSSEITKIGCQRKFLKVTPEMRIIFMPWHCPPVIFPNLPRHVGIVALFAGANMFGSNIARPCGTSARTKSLVVRVNRLGIPKKCLFPVELGWNSQIYSSWK